MDGSEDIGVESIINEMRLTALGCEDVKPSRLVQGRVKLCAVVKLWVPYRARNNNIDNKLDATIAVFNNSNQLIMFRATISPILRSTRLCLQLVV